MQSREEYKAEKAATIQINLTIVDQAGIYGNDYALVLPGSWSAQLNFVRSGNTASLDLKTILYLLTISKKVMVKMLDIMVEFIILIFLPFWIFISRLFCSVVSDSPFKES